MMMFVELDTQVKLFGFVVGDVLLFTKLNHHF